MLAVYDPPAALTCSTCECPLLQAAPNDCACACHNHLGPTLVDRYVVDVGRALLD